MKYQDKKVAGIWMDKDHAQVYHTNDYSCEGDFVMSKKIDSAHHGHHGTSEHVGHQKKKQETTRYFKTLASHLSEVDAVYLIGPGQSQEQFRNFLKSDKQLSKIEIDLGTADHLSPNQIIAKIRTHFGQN